MNRTNTIVGAAFLALLTLFAFQVKWMIDSRNLIEEQFNQKVNMALCYAVDDVLGTEQGLKSCASNTAGCLPIQEVGEGFQLETNNDIDVSTIENALGIALDFYNIDMAYEVEVMHLQEFALCTSPTKTKKYSCSLNPLEKSESNLLLVSFPGKQEYIFGKMKFMFFSSIIILAFISLVFILATYTILRQKRLHQIHKEFFNNMAHEFRTPLTNISLASSLLLKGKVNERESRYLEIVKDESKKLTNQVERILHLAKLENGEYQLHKEELCLKDLIESIIKDMELQIREKKAIINFEIDNESTMLVADKFHLGNAFRNLLENALKYSNTAPEVKISLEKSEGGMLVHFQDNGIGIAKKDQKEVFEKYHRVNQGDVHNQKGFGLGLAYVKMIIERHKGMIKIFSDLNKGTRFDLFLPVK